MRSLLAAALAWVLGAFALLSGSAPLRAQGWNDPVRCASNDGHYARCVMPWRRCRASSLAISLRRISAVASMK